MVPGDRVNYVISGDEGRDAGEQDVDAAACGLPARGQLSPGGLPLTIQLHERVLVDPHVSGHEFSFFIGLTRPRGLLARPGW